MKKAVEIKSIIYSYGKNQVLKDLSFAVTAGEFFIIIGPNGSGKTTLMKMIAGIKHLQEGQLNIFDRSIREYPRKHLARTMSFVPQMVSVDFPFTVMELVLMGRSPYLGMLGLEQKNDIEIAEQAIAFTGVEHLADRKIDELSGGECQRVFIARAICQEPDIILLDEPTASLDLSNQIRVMDLMERLKKEKGVTVIMVSHDVNLAAMYGDQILLLKKGEILSIGKPDDVLFYKTLEDAYGCALLVDESPLGAFKRVTPVPKRFIK